MGQRAKAMGSDHSGVPDTGDTHCLSRPSWGGSTHVSPGKNSMSPMFRNKMKDRDPIGKFSNYYFRTRAQEPCMCRGVSAAIHSQGSELSVPGLVAWA